MCSRRERAPPSVRSQVDGTLRDNFEMEDWALPSEQQPVGTGLD